MDELQKEFVYLTIKTKKNEDKRYLISNLLREKLKEEKNYYIGIIPYYSITSPIYNINREFFVNNSYFRAACLFNNFCNHCGIFY